MATYTPTEFSRPKRITLDTNRRKVDLVNITGDRWVRIFCTTECYFELPGGDDGTALGSDYETIQASVPFIRRIPHDETAFCITASSGTPIAEITFAGDRG